MKLAEKILEKLGTTFLIKLSGDGMVNINPSQHGIDPISSISSGRDEWTVELNDKDFKKYTKILKKLDVSIKGNKIIDDEDGSQFGTVKKSSMKEALRPYNGKVQGKNAEAGDTSVNMDHYHKTAVDVEGNGQTIMTLPHSYPDHTHDINDWELGDTNNRSHIIIA